jgi:hypothetical protein
MMTFPRGAVLALLALLAVPARAQDNLTFDPMDSGSYRPDKSVWSLNWEISKPTGDFSNYVDRVSYTGFSIESRSMVRKNVSAGISFSYNRWDQTYPNAQRTSGNTTITGPLFNYADMFGLRALAHYYFLEGSTVQPYVGAGIGGAWSYGYQQSADLYTSKDNFNFIVSPEVGALIYLARGGTNLGLNLAVRYTYSTAHYGNTTDAQTFSGIAGFMWSY